MTAVAPQVSAAGEPDAVRSRATAGPSNHDDGPDVRPAFGGRILDPDRRANVQLFQLTGGRIVVGFDACVDLGLAFTAFRDALPLGPEKQAVSWDDGTTDE